LAVEAGVSVLARGGSAVDAAIAVQLVLNLVEPQSSGIGGGAFMLHFDPQAAPAAQLLAYDGRETAPQAIKPQQFLDAQGKPLPFLTAVDSGLSVGTPGLLRLLYMAHQGHGRLPWATLFAPAIALAEQGFAISPRLHTSVQGAAARIQAQGEPVASYFLNPDGSAKAVGTRLYNPAFAATLRQLAQAGPDAFYQGDIARDIVSKVRSHPRAGALSEADLYAYQAKVRPPVCATYRVRFRICGMPPPSSGGLTTLQTLGLLERFDLARLNPVGAEAVHLVSDAYRLAYADRALYIADDDFVAVPTAGLLDRHYLQQRSALLSMDKSLGTPSAGTPPGLKTATGLDASAPLPSTSHISIVDAQGRAVSMTTTIENGFGSLQMVRGFLLNNQLTDFSFTTHDAQGRPIANRIEPGKRPRSSMAPTMVFDAQTGALEAVLGSPGGSAIIQYTTKTLLGLIDWQLNIQQAISLPNFGAQTSAVTLIEKGSVLDTPSVRDDLSRKGHTVNPVPTLTSGLHGLVFNGTHPNGQRGLFAIPTTSPTTQWTGGADPRREGVAQGTP
jgi:gamma-glutamyltranspeptidase/glutathione hydrolase